MSLSLGVDAGGTRTIALAIDEGGNEVARAGSGPGNPLAVGDERAAHSLRAAVESVLAELPETPAAAHFGMAGAGRPRDEERARRLIESLGLDCPAGLSDDATTSFWSEARPPGIVLVAGTGSIAAALGLDGVVVRSGGYGYLLGDEGSGYWIGQQAVRAALRASDGRASATILTEIVHEMLGRTLDDVISDAHGGRLDRAALAGIAPAVLAADDDVARAITGRAVDELAALVRSCVARLGAVDAQELPLVLAGGLLVHNEQFRRRLEQSITGIDPRIDPQVLRHSPALGAARLAAMATR
jgi:glucosamine kinase